MAHILLGAMTNLILSNALRNTNQSSYTESNNTQSEISNHEIFCQGKLLHTAQMARLFDDSKYFVDMKLKLTPAGTLKNFDEFMSRRNQNPTRDEIALFVVQHFEPPGQEFEKWFPEDHTKSPSILRKISDPKLREWAAELNEIWGAR